MPAGLPKVCLFGAGGDYGCRQGEPVLGDVVVPPSRWAALSYLLDLWAQYPTLTQGKIDDCNRGWQRIVRGLALVEAARLTEERLELNEGWPTWQVAFLAGGIGVGAIALGILVGYVAGAAQAVFAF